MALLTVLGHLYDVRGSPEGHSLFGRGLGVSPRDYYFLPPSFQEGVWGMVRATNEAITQGCYNYVR